MTIPVPILLYHSVSDRVAPKFRKWSVSPRQFAAQMNYLRVNQFTPITVSQFARGMQNGCANLFGRPIVVTFDDGFADFGEDALPILLEYGIAATLYIPTAFVGKTSYWLRRSDEGDRPMLTWSQIAEISASGIECGGHSHTHSQLDTLSLRAAWDEITRCKTELEQHLGKEVSTFAYPHGYHSRALERLVQEAGYSSACAVKNAVSATTDDHFALARVVVTDDLDLGCFERTLEGLGVPVAPLQERTQTKMWRIVRRSAAWIRADSCLESTGLASLEEVAIAEAPPHREDPDRQDELRVTPAEKQLLLINLLNTFAELASLLRVELRRGSWLDAYLLATGMNQIVEDYLHADPYSLGTAAKYLGRMRQPVGPVAARIARLAGSAVIKLRTRRARTQHLLRWQAELANFVQQLAEIVATPTVAVGFLHEALRETGEQLVGAIDRLPPRLLSEVLRLPSCFRSFDQQPDDLKRITREFAERWPNRAKPLVVVGIRTSGSYLAPLYGAFLKASGYKHVTVLTLRPGRPLLGSERSLLKSIAQSGGLALVADDPPATGDSLAKAIQDLVRAGIPAHTVVLLLQLFGPRSTLPPSLRDYASVLLPRTAWAIEEQLFPPAVQATLADLLGPMFSVCNIQRLPMPTPQLVRSHVCALYRVNVLDRASGQVAPREILLKGVGLGYFGRHTLAVASRLRDFLPEIYGVRAGLCYRAWLPEEQRLLAIEPDRAKGIATSAAVYVKARQQALAVKEDVSRRLFGRQPVWEIASNILSQAFGRGWLVVRPIVIDPIVQDLLRVKRPAVIDGNTSLSHWFDREKGAIPLLKVDFDEHAFCNLDLTCYDPIYDLAGMAVSGSDHTFSAYLRDAFEHATGDTIGEERWLIYQLVRLWDHQRTHTGSRDEVRRRCARVMQTYFSTLYLKQCMLECSGPLCAIDIDGVLETAPLGFPSLTPSGALTLRALMAHGYRPILVTGRSLSEVRERCCTYYLPGGVAEYGAAIYRRDADSVVDLLSDTDHADLNRLRSVLTDIDGIYLDPDYRYAVRAYRLDSAGHRTRLSSETVSLALARARLWDRVSPISGQAQTDFMVARIDKGVGLKSLAAELDKGNSNVSTVTLAVGDTIADLPMFELATLAFAPANADLSVKQAGVSVVNRPYQAGLAQAASHLLGHMPGACPICEGPNLSRDARLLLTILATQETGMWGMLRCAFSLGLRLRQG